MIDAWKNNLQSEIAILKKLWQSLQDVTFGESPESLDHALQLVQRNLQRFQEIRAQFHAIGKATSLDGLSWKSLIKRFPTKQQQQMEALCRSQEKETTQVKTAINECYRLLGYHIQLTGKLLEILVPGNDTYNGHGRSGKHPRSIAVNHHG